MTTLTVPELAQCLVTSQHLAAEYLQVLGDAMAKYAIDTPLRQAHFLAQLGHESLGLVYRAEIASGEKYELRADLGNIYPGDGVKFKGRGFFQITGRANYRMYGHSIGIDLEEHPHLLEESPYCADSAGWYWDEKNLSHFADKDDVIMVTRLVNGGLNHIDDREKRLAICKLALKI